VLFDIATNQFQPLFDRDVIMAAFITAHKMSYCP
jgi:hypothetical protein